MTRGEVVAEATAALGDRREARLVVAAALGLKPAEIVGWPERAVDEGVHARAVEFVRRRAAGEPLSRLRGTREFWSLDFALSPETLDPRPETETLVAAALETVPDRAAPLRLLDLGTGTGCLLLALLSELPNAWGLGLDRAAGAATTARANAAALGLARRATFLVGNWGAALSGRFDLIVSNPPYIPSGEIAALAPEVRHDPRRALDGGADGLDAYRALAPDLARLLGGTAFIELGADQAPAAAEIMRGAGLDVRAARPDLAGIDRCLILGPGENNCWKPLPSRLG
jgi:release factor glutamine methyltransferase